MHAQSPTGALDWDAIIVGSGFGGAVSALRVPALGLHQGFFAQEVYRHVSLVRGIAVGGGSVV
jgi:hypothetical protein